MILKTFITAFCMLSLVFILCPSVSSENSSIGGLEGVFSSGTSTPPDWLNIVGQSNPNPQNVQTLAQPSTETVQKSPVSKKKAGKIHRSRKRVVAKPIVKKPVSPAVKPVTATAQPQSTINLTQPASQAQKLLDSKSQVAVTQTEMGRPDKIALLGKTDGESKPDTRKTGDTVKTILSTLVKLAFVLFLAYMTILVLKWLSGKRDVASFGSHDLRVVNTLRLSQNSSLHIVNVMGKTMLVGSSTGQVNLLREFEETELEPEKTPETADSRFAEYLEKYSAGSGSPANRVGGLLRDCTAYLKKRQMSAGGIAGLRAGVKDET